MSTVSESDIKDYFSAPLSQMRPGVIVPFSVSIYLKHNQHLIVWMNKDQVIEADAIQAYANKGLQRVWIHDRDRAEFERYVNEKNLNVKIPPPTEPTPPSPRRTREGELVGRAITGTTLSEASKRKVVTEVGSQAIVEAARAQTGAQQEVVTHQHRSMVQDILHHAANPEHRGFITEMLDMAQMDPDLDHAVNVATYTVIFSLAFGHVEPALLSDFAMAGLLHDYGVTQVPWKDAKVPWLQQSKSSKKQYSEHVERSLELISAFHPTASKRVLELVRQSHEMFDGSGYPHHLKGFEFDDIAQLLALAELLDSICSGQWDGQKRSFREGFECIESFERETNFPRYFNPEIFRVIHLWIHDEKARKAFEHATLTVQNETQKLLAG